MAQFSILESRKEDKKKSEETGITARKRGRDYNFFIYFLKKRKTGSEKVDVKFAASFNWRGRPELSHGIP